MSCFQNIGMVVDVGWGGLPRRYLGYWKLNVSLLEGKKDGNSFVDWWMQA